MKNKLRILIQVIHQLFLHSPIRRIYVAVVIAPHKVRTVKIYGTKCRFVIQNSFVNWYVENFPGISPNELQTQEYLIKILREEDVFYDIGANIGAYVIWIANAFHPKKIVAFEPEAVNYSALSENVKLNGLDDVTCLPVAASNQAGYGVFWTEHGGAGNASGFTDDYSASKQGGKLKQYIRQDRVDELIEQGIISAPDVVLIDVDGGEVMVLEGMQDCLPNCRIVIVEVAEDTEKAVDKLLKSSGFLLELKRVQRRGNNVYVNSRLS